MILLLATTLLALSPQDAPRLTPELLVDHPGLSSADYTRVREDWLAALENDPNSPWASAAARLIPTLEVFCDRGIDPDRLGRLIERVDDVATRQSLGETLRREITRVRFTDDAIVSATDPGAGFISRWGVLGPYGALDGASPLLDLDDENAPHSKLVTEYPSTWGPTLEWLPVERRIGRPGVDASEWLFPYSGGTAYLLSFIEAPVEFAQLEIQCADALQVFWNGVLVVEELRHGLTQQDSRFVVPVALNPGANALLIRVENGQTSGVSARLNTQEGKLLSTTESDWSPDRFPAWSRSEPVPPMPEPAKDPALFAGVLDMLLATENFRSDKALAAPEPAEAERPAWLRARYRAVMSAAHLPAEVDRRFRLEIEEQLETLDVFYPEIELARAERLVGEDKLAEAIEIAEELARAYPDVARFHELLYQCLGELDDSGALSRPLIEETTRRFPGYSSAWMALAAWCESERNLVDAREYALRAMAADGGNIGATDLVLRLCISGDRSRIAIAQEIIDKWREIEPDPRLLEAQQFEIWENIDAIAAMESRLIENAERKPNTPLVWIQLADFYTRRGDEEAALPLYERALDLESDNEAVRTALERRGLIDDAEEFFREFGPDAAEANAALPESTDAATALVLDSRMVYVRPDGSSRSRTHQIMRALNRLGTEILHEQPAMEDTRVARVIDKEGATFEPVLVEGTWVMPSLDPGDSVEMIFDEYAANWPGIAPRLDAWFFQSFDQPFIRSRYVLYLPDGVPGKLEKLNFDGTHEEIPWRDGVVHILQTKDRPQLEDEGSIPSRPEIVPWIEYGADVNVDDVARYYTESLAYGSDLADDIEHEVAPLVEWVVSEHAPEDRARALYDAVTEHVLDFAGEGDTTDVWGLRRGEPSGLLAALFELAGVEFEWAIFSPPFAPDLDPNPARAFSTWSDFVGTCFRFPSAEEGGEPSWLCIPPNGRGFPFGRVPSELTGARVLVLEGGGDWRFETLPAPAEPTWRMELDLAIAVNADKSARVNGSMTISDAIGPMLREGLAQAEPEARAQWVRQRTSNLVSGLDLETWDIPTLETRGEDLVLTFRGTIPRFVRGGGSRPYCKLPISAGGLSGISKTERTYPLVLRVDHTDRVRVRIDFGDAWTYAFDQETLVAELDGFALRMITDKQESVLEVTREMYIRGMWLDPDEVPDFLTRAKELEDALTAKVELTKTE